MLIKKLKLLIICLMIAFSSLSQIDTTGKICFTRKVVIGIQKDLIRLDLCDSIDAIKDSMIINRNKKIQIKDSIIDDDKIKINLYKSSEKAYKSEIQITKDESDVYKKEIKKQKRLKVEAIILGISAVLVTIFIFK